MKLKYENFLEVELFHNLSSGLAGFKSRLMGAEGREHKEGLSSIFFSFFLFSFFYGKNNSNLFINYHIKGRMS